MCIYRDLQRQKTGEAKFKKQSYLQRTTTISVMRKYFFGQPYVTQQRIDSGRILVQTLEDR